MDNAQKTAEEALRFAEDPHDPSLWSEPIPLYLQSKACPYPVAALPAVIRDAVTEAEEFAQYPLALPACSALSVLSLVCQGLANVRRAEKLEGPISLYFLVVADSGERKTSADTHFMGQLHAYDKQMRTDNEIPLGKYKADLEIFDSKKLGLKMRLQKAKKDSKTDATVESEMTELELNAPQPPVYPQLLYTDATPEALANNLAFKWPSAGVMSSEAGIVFGGHAMSKESMMRNLALLNTLWDGKSHKVDRVTGKSLILEDVRLSMGLAVQVTTIRAFFENSKGLARDTGFAARFLMAHPESTQGKRFYREPPAAWPSLSAFQKRIQKLLDYKTEVEKGGLILSVLELSDEAKKFWVQCYNEIEKELAPGGTWSELRDVASKAADNITRLAALFHLFEYGLEVKEINVEHVESASVIVKWHLQEAKRFLGEFTISKEMLNAHKLETWLISWFTKNATNEIGTTKILQNAPMVVRKKIALDDALDVLETHHRIRRLVRDGTNIIPNPALFAISSE